MTDPLAEVVTLLQPQAPSSKRVSAAGPWRVRRADPGRPFYGAILEGACRLAVEGHASMTLQQGDFVLIPAAYNFEMSSILPPEGPQDGAVHAVLADGEIRHGSRSGPPELRAVVGYCVFGSADAALLVSLLPRLVHVRGERRLATLVQLVGEETRGSRPAREVILKHLLEVLLIEALRSTAGTEASAGLLRGLADERLAAAIRRMHQTPSRPWTVVQLAKEAALSRSAFFARFSSTMGMPPMEYLLAWRMALARDLLRRKEGGISEVAGRVGYRSASTFTMAFTRHVGVPPGRYARQQAQDEPQAPAVERP